MATTMKETIKRIAKDVANIIKNPLDSNGIFYSHDEDDILKGYALIIGPENTPYAYGYYLFKLDFPNNYPYAPPKVTYLTNDGNTRFHPNLYRNGKVCLSILNTWRGEQWSSCQTISSILLTIISVMTKDPLYQEPGMNKFNSKKESEIFNKIIQYKNIEVAIFNILLNKYNLPIYELFCDKIIESFKINKDNILNNINLFKKTTKPDVLYCDIYKMTYGINYNLLLGTFKTINI